MKRLASAPCEYGADVRFTYQKISSVRVFCESLHILRLIKNIPLSDDLRVLLSTHYEGLPVDDTEYHKRP